MVRSHAALRRFFPVAAFLTTVMTAVPASADDMGANKSDLIRSLLPTVVNISVRKQEPAGGATPAADAASAPAGSGGPTIKAYVGSGFIIDPSGLIVTNYHVVEDAFEVTVMFSDGSRLPGKMLSASRLADLAIVQVKADHPLAAAHWGNSDTLQVGDQVFAAGNPFGLGLSVSAGIVSALNRDIQNSPYDDLIQTDAPINHGNSGGPLFDMLGNVVGVNSVIISPTTGSVGLGFAIPAASAHFVVDQLRTYGWVHPGWIGIKMQQVSGEIANALGMDNPHGSIVAWVLPEGPAMKAGLRIGDVILRFDGKAPTDERALLRELAHTMEGTTVTLSVLRDGAVRDFPVTVQAWPRNQWDARDAPLQVQAAKIIIPPDLGLSLSSPDSEERAKLGLEDGLDGVLVTDVAANSDAARRGMKGGDVILRVQDQPVATPDAVQSGVDSVRAERREFVLMLVLPKVRDVPGPQWRALRLSEGG